MLNSVFYTLIFLGSSSTPIIETVAVSQNSEPEDSFPCYEHPDCEFDIKKEVFRGEADAEVDDLNETRQINPDSGDGYLDHFDSGENIPNPESSSDHNSNRPKRKARVMAEEILRRTVTSEMDQRKMSDEDSDSEYEGYDFIIVLNIVPFLARFNNHYNYFMAQE